MPKKSLSGIPRRTAFLYLVIASVYIYVSDRLLLYISDPEMLGYYQTYKGWGYVVVTAILLYFLLRGQIGQLLAEMEERRKAEEAEKMAARHWQQTFDASADAICLLDIENRILRVNRTMAAMAGAEPEALVGQKCCAILHGDNDFEDCPLQKLNELEKRRESELKLGDRWYIVSVDPVFNEEGVLQHIVHILHDITARKEIEENVRTQRNALQSLYSLSTLMRTAKTGKELLAVVLKEAIKLLQAHDGAVTMLSADREHFTIVEAEGFWADHIGYKFPVDKGLCSIVLQTEKPFDSVQYCEEERKLQYLKQSEVIGPIALVPLKTETETIGVLEVSRRQKNGGNPFTTEEVELLTAIGEIAGNALRRQSLFESAQNRLKQLQGLRNIDTAIAGSLDLNLTFNVILNEVTSLLGLDAAAILLLEKNTAALRYEAARGFYGEKLPALTLQPGEGYAGQVIKERNPVHINDLSKADSEPLQETLLKNESFATYYAVPLIAKGRVQGVLEGYHRKKQEPDEEWLSFFKALAGQTAIAIDNAELFQSMENANFDLLQAYDATIEGWAYALDLKDEETEDHSQRVTNLTLRVARKMNIKEEELPHIKRGALLHDIGKMGVPDSILLKPGPLTDEEWEVMRRHPVFAYEMLSRIEYLRPAIDIPYCHHEKFDGTGYPRGLKGEEIPLPARIFAVVDVYDALTSDRPYRKAWSKEKTLALIKEESGKHFDPDVVEVFLQEIG